MLLLFSLFCYAGIFLLLRIAAMWLGFYPVFVLLLGSAAAYILFFILSVNRIYTTRHVVWVIGFGLLLRLLFFGSDPTILSEDVYRYLWDGKVQYYGHNPFVCTPDSPQCESMRAGSIVYDNMKYTDCSTIYPALAQMVFLAAYGMSGESLWGLRLIYLLAEILLLVFVFMVMRHRIKYRWISLYALCPLLIIEAYLGMHIDIIGMVVCIPSLWLAQKRRWYAALAVLVCSIHVKYISGVLLPVFVITAWRERFSVTYGRPLVRAGKSFVCTAMPMTITALMLATMLFLPYITAGTKLFEQLGTYCAHWEFNSSIFSLAYALFDVRARILMPVITVLGCCYIALRNDMDMINKAEVAFILFLLCTHTVYPWYALWLVPFFCIRPKSSVLFFITAFFISYEVLLEYKKCGVWEQKMIIRLFQYVPFCILLLRDMVKGAFIKDA